MIRILLVLLLLSFAARAEVTVFAAASLTEALREAGAAWAAAGHAPPRLVFAASSTLARQVEAGAPADIFASADLQWADYLDKRGLLAAGTRRNLLGNALVLVVPKAAARTVDPADVVAVLGRDGRLAVGDPAHVPAGIYAEQALRHLGVWTAVERRLARAQDVRGALLLVARGETPAGIVYATDAAADPGVAVAGVFPAASHNPIVYPFAVTRAGDRAEVRDFFAFLQTPSVRTRFAARGFVTE